MEPGIRSYQENHQDHTVATNALEAHTHTLVDQNLEGTPADDGSSKEFEATLETSHAGSNGTTVVFEGTEYTIAGNELDNNNHDGVPRQMGDTYIIFQS